MLNETVNQAVEELLSKQPYSLLFLTLSGAHLYGFDSPDSDYDLRGVHVLPVKEVIGLKMGKDSIDFLNFIQEIELDLVTFDLKKFIQLLLKNNGNVMEQLYSPLLIKTSPEHEELKEIARGCRTRYHAYHYLGLANTQWQLLQKHEPFRVKPLLYVYRSLLTGMYLLESGEVEANLSHLNKHFQLSYIPELIEAKKTGPEKGILPEQNLDIYEKEYIRLTRMLKAMIETTELPESPSKETKAALHDFLVRLRYKYD